MRANATTTPDGRPTVWLNCGHVRFGRSGPPGDGKFALIVHRRNSRVGAVEILLPEMREVELIAIRDFINETIDLAIPESRKNDMKAEEDRANQIPNNRNYRQVPTINQTNWPK